MVETSEPGGEFASAIHELSVADVVAFGGVGLVGQVLPPTEAYHAIEAALPERAEAFRPQLRWLLANGSAAGKAYAASLLGRLDPVAARAAWESMVDDRSELTTFSGCLMAQTTLGEYAAERLDNG